ncbi:MAG: DNA-3-methyladenine glycosylase I [Phycisphaerales bacterium JB059]
MLTLEGAQAGLSWRTVLAKRENYRRVFHGFDAARVGAMDAGEVEAILGEAEGARAVIRHRGKVMSVIENARAILNMRDKGIGLGEHLWGFVEGRPVTNRFRSRDEIPPQTEVSRGMSRDLKARGFRFVGPTTCYSLMQASGMVNDHVIGCYRHAEVGTGG